MSCWKAVVMRQAFWELAVCRWDDYVDWIKLNDYFSHA